MTSKKFIVTGQPIGYYASGFRPNRDRLEQYVSYKKKVALFAQMAQISCPLESSLEKPITINVVCYFADGRHSDTGNVQKGICDALFYRGKGVSKAGGGDKFTGGSFVPPRYDKDNPRCEVEVIFE